MESTSILKEEINCEFAPKEEPCTDSFQPEQMICKEEPVELTGTSSTLEQTICKEERAVAVLKEDSGSAQQITCNRHITDSISDPIPKENCTSTADQITELESSVIDSILEPITDEINEYQLSQQKNSNEETELEVPILDSILEPLTEFKDFNQRYFVFKYHVKFPKSGDFDVAVRIHNNKVMLISLATGHDIIRKKKTIDEVVFQINCNTNRANIKMSGKGKRGAAKLCPNSILCYIKCSDYTVYPVYCGVHGKLIEVNEAVVEKPKILISNRLDIGYIAIILPDLKRIDTIEKSLLSEEQYLQYLKSRVN